MNVHCNTQSRNNLRDASLHLDILGKESEPVSNTGCKKKIFKTNKGGLKGRKEGGKMVYPDKKNNLELQKSPVE